MADEFKGDGFGCVCYAHCEGECACDADWTDSEIYKLRARVKVLEEALVEIGRHCMDVMQSDAHHYRELNVSPTYVIETAKAALEGK